MDYEVIPQSGKSYTHIWDVSTVEVYDGGFLLDKSNLPAGLKVLPRGAFMAVDLEERTAIVVKTATLHDAITPASEVVRVAKGSLLTVGDIIGKADKFVTVGAIDSSNDEYDSFEIIAGALGELPISDVLQSYVNEAVASVDGFNYGDVKVDAQPTVSVIFKVFKVESKRLPFPITDEIISSLKHCQIL